jgi:hypothetical protein
MEHKLTVLDTLKKDRWVFRVSLLEAKDLNSIMLIYCNIKEPTLIGIRFFDTDEKVTQFVHECSIGKYGDSVDKE